MKITKVLLKFNNIKFYEMLFLHLTKLIVKLDLKFGIFIFLNKKTFLITIIF